MRYAIIKKGTTAAKGWWSIEEYEVEYSPIDSMMVHEDEAFDTGLINENGDSIYRCIDRIGFIRWP